MKEKEPCSWVLVDSPDVYNMQFLELYVGKTIIAFFIFDRDEKGDLITKNLCLTVFLEHVSFDEVYELLEWGNPLTRDELKLLVSLKSRMYQIFDAGVDHSKYPCFMWFKSKAEANRAKKSYESPEGKELIIRMFKERMAER